MRHTNYSAVMSRALQAMLLTAALSACGPSEPPTCEECLVQRGQGLPADGCYPYCEEDLTDTDGDGIEDTADTCPNEPETQNGYEDTDGCPDVVPDPLTLGTWTGEATITMDGRTFTYNETIIVTKNATPGYVDIAESCPSAGPTVTTTTTNDTATWTGVMACPQTSLPWCDVTYMRHEIVSVSVGTDGLARIHMNGHADGCGRSKVPYSVVLLGSK